MLEIAFIVLRLVFKAILEIKIHLGHHNKLACALKIFIHIEYRSFKLKFMRHK